MQDRPTAFVALLLCSLIIGCDKDAPVGTSAHEGPVDSGLSGQELVAVHCSSCHLIPEPGDLPKAKWEFALGWMSHYLGLGDGAVEYQRLLTKELVHDQPLLTQAEFDRIRDYFTSGAPETVAPAFPRDRTLPETPMFRGEALAAYKKVQTITLVKIDPRQKRLFIGAGEDALLQVYSSDGRLLEQHDCSGVEPVDVKPRPDGFDLVLLGSLERDTQRATAVRISRTGNPQRPIGSELLLSGFHRCSGAAWGDLDGDGREDIVMAGYGEFATGALAWFKRQPGGESERHDLLAGAGALDPVVDDVDGDGDLDVLCLVAQGRNEMWWFENDGSGGFEGHLLWKQRAGFGYNCFEWVDVDGDGRKDIVAVSGNNMELPDYPLKPYHGIYLHRQTGTMQFEQDGFLRFDGAMKAIARDFDGDGDVDIAAISGAPDLRAESPHGFVLFENDGEASFHATGIDPRLGGRWMTMDAGDLDGDGDDDLVLGASALGPLPGQPLYHRVSEWIARWPPVVVLWNREK